MKPNIFYGFIVFVWVFLITSSRDSKCSDVFQKKKYNYAFDVFPVDSCPMNESAWKVASKRIGCNDTQRYHCVPDKFHESLIEFCYSNIRILASGENCLELAASGILNYVKCQNCNGECPNKPYFSDEIYKYPVCLDIEFGCFSSDGGCFRQKLKDIYTQKKEIPTNSTQKDCEQQEKTNTSSSNNCIYKTSFLVLSISVSFLLVIIGIVFLSMKIIKKRRKASLDEDKLHLEYIRDKVHSEYIQDKVHSAPDNENEYQLASVDEDKLHLDNTFEHKLQKLTIAADLNVLGEGESKLMFDSIHLLLELRRHCQNGNFEYVHFLLKKSLSEQVENLKNILTSRDKNGYTLLHCTAEGGSVEIFKALINSTNQIEVDDTTYDGRTVLHIACKNKHVSLCRFLLSENDYKNVLLKKKSKTGWNAAHYAAVGGSMEIFNLLDNRLDIKDETLLEDNRLDIKDETLAGLNVLDIACLHNHTELCKMLMNRSDLSLSLDKSDDNGWTIAHYAAMVGNDCVFDHLIKKNNKPIKTKRQKTILHVCCEYGNYKICERILNHYKEIVFDKDDKDWNALHYAAKGGNLSVFQQVEKIFKQSARLYETTRDKKTVLRIASIYKNNDVSRYICKKTKRVLLPA